MFRVAFLLRARGLARGLAPFGVAACVAPGVAVAAEASLNAPASVQAGGEVSVEFTGPGASYDRIVIVPAGSPDDVIVDANATYANGSSPLRVTAPEEAGAHEIRYYDSTSKTILARRAIVTTPISATLHAPATAVPGSTIAVSWTGPANYDDRIVVLPVGTPENTQSQESPGFTPAPPT